MKVLDLSNNKINGTLLKDINKNSIGKYLKVIKLYGNQIDKNDASIVKKV